MTRLAAGAIVVAIFAFALGIAVLEAWLLTLVWNALVPQLGGPELNFWLALGLLFVANAIFGGRR